MLLNLYPAGALSHRQLQGLGALSKVEIVVVGSCLTSALVAFTCSLHIPPGICASGYNQTAHHKHSLSTQQICIEYFLYATAYAGIKRSVGAWAVSSLFMYVSPAPNREPGTQKVLKKHLLLTILSLLWEFLSQLTPWPQPRERQGGHEEAKDREDFSFAALETTPSGPVLQESPKCIRALCPGTLCPAKSVQGQKKPQCVFINGLANSSRSRCPWEVALRLSLGKEREGRTGTTLG